MILRNLLRSSSRVLPQAIPRVLPKPPSLAFRQSSPLPRFSSNFSPRNRRPPRIVYYKSNPDEGSRAKPLPDSEQVSRAFADPTTKWIIIIAVGSGTAFYFANLETVPVSGRRRFNCYSDASVEAEGARMYTMIMKENHDSLLPARDSRSKMVERVMQKLIPASGLESVNVGLPWRFWGSSN